MIRSSVTISLVPEARGGPFVFWDDLAAACREAKRLGFDAVEVFAPPTVDPAALKRSLDDNGLKLAAMGTGAGWVLHRLTLTSPDAGVREKAVGIYPLRSSTWPARSAPRRSSARCRAATATASMRRKR